VLHYVTPSLVNESRKNYDIFQWHMYGEVPSHFAVLTDGTKRGLPEFFQPELFASLPGHIKTEVCSIPLSQPLFFILVLFVWTVTCIGDIRKALDIFESLVISTPTVESLEGIVVFVDATFHGARRAHNKIIVGLTWQLKVFITFILVIPRILLVCVLLWLGSRWLAGTNNFGDLIMNSVALEFILLLGNLLYVTLVPARSKRDCQSIEVCPPSDKEAAGLYVYATSFLWGVVALAWAMMYTYYFQQVLPEYNWDVRDVCAGWLEQPLCP